MTLKMDTLLADGVTIVACSGRIVFGEEASGLREGLKKLLETTKRIVLNLAGSPTSTAGGWERWWGVFVGARPARGHQADRSRPEAARRSFDHQAGHRIRGL